MRLIDADALIRDIEHYHLSDGMFQHWVEIQNTIEPERKKGKWTEIKHTFFHKCSVCSWLNDVDSGYSFCPRCGSYNGGEQDEA